MEKIASFTVDHTKLEKGLYVSRIDGDVVTYDLRTRVPNKDEVMGNGAIHTVEHLAATYLRNSEYRDSIIYFGPMGCRTGFYFLCRGMNDEQVLALLKECFTFVADYEGEIPGATAVECGNWREHDLAGAKSDAADYRRVLDKVTSTSY